MSAAFVMTPGAFLMLDLSCCSDRCVVVMFWEGGLSVGFPLQGDSVAGITFDMMSTLLRGYKPWYGALVFLMPTDIRSKSLLVTD